MLKDKYSFKLPVHEVQLLATEFDKMFEQYSDYKVANWLLMLTVLKPIKIKIATKLMFPKKTTTLVFSQSQAVAFMAAYEQSLIRFNLTTSKINAEIHKTIV
jgi:hypothetical protein